jgi:ABC-2 type transport system ATP-binding protein
MTPAIECHHLVKTYSGRTGPVEAVRGIDLEVARGVCFGLLGPNGAGKTTTIEILEGLLPPSSGEVLILGKHWGEDDGDLRERVGIALQDTRLEEKLTARETVALFRSFYRRGSKPHEALALVGLTGKANAFVGQLSGGQRQRLALACALVGQPELLFLDEPTTGLDPQSRRELWDVLMRFRDGGGSILLTTHAMDEAEQLCDTVAIIDSGLVISAGSPAELIARADGEHVLEFAVTGGGVLEEGELKELPGVASVRAVGDGYRLGVAAPHRTLPELLRLLEERRLVLSRVTTRHASLEDVFLTLTGRHWPAESSAGEA